MKPFFSYFKNALKYFSVDFYGEKFLREGVVNLMILYGKRTPIAAYFCNLLCNVCTCTLFFFVKKIFSKYKHF